VQKSDINVLIVEDDTTQRDSLVAAVKKAGYKAVGVRKPEEAESLARLKPIHGLVVDCMLPGKSGVELVESLKTTVVDEAVVIFVSGIYRDKSYQQEAVTKTKAERFFQKPFNLEELTALLSQKLDRFVETPKVDLHALLAAPFASQRERRKALDHVEEMYGFDLPFVFSILMESESSGYLNIVDERQNIFGVTFAKGLIAKVDSETTILQTRKILLRHGFITEKELDEVTQKKPSDLVKALVDEGLMSPHVQGLIKAEQIIIELNRIVGPDKLNINFVQDRKMKPEVDDLNGAQFLPQLHDMVANKIPFDYLKKFYATWLGHVIRLGPGFQDQPAVLALPLARTIPGLFDMFKGEVTIEDIVSNHRAQEETVYRSIHLLALRRVVVFDETRRVKNLEEHIARLKNIHASIKGKNPVEIFQYFGLSANPKAREVNQIYKEFAKSNHPDTLPASAPEDVKKMNHEVFSSVTGAHDILTDETKKEKHLNEMKQATAEKQLRAEDDLAEAYALMTRGKFTEARPKIAAARLLYDSEKAKLYEKWVLLKTGATSKETALTQIDELRKMSSDAKKTALYLFVSGMLRRRAGFIEDAERELNKALQADGNFMDVRRELASLNSTKPEKISVNDMLTGDITSVFGKVFGKKKGA
jgi:CheY-like chemotaxis protein